MNLLRLKVGKLKRCLDELGVDVNYVVLRSGTTLRYMVSEVYYPPPEDMAIQRIVLDFGSGGIEIYVSPLEYYRVREIYGDAGVDVYAVLSSCADVPQDMRCIEKDRLDSITVGKVSKYKSIAVDDMSLCRDAICVDIGKAIKEIRRRKSIEEVDLIKSAVAIAEQALHEISSEITPGLSELAIASMVEGKARELGAEGYAFNTIVAIGENTAKPHHTPSRSKVYGGSEPILIDFGVRVSGYVSDITKVFIPRGVDQGYVDLLNAVEEAIAQTLPSIRNGVRCCEVDEKARSVLRSFNLHRYFIHGVGHGLGVDVHEDPRLIRTSNDVLVQGDVVTVEPGVYIYGRYGARLEIDVYVDTVGAQILTRMPKVIVI